MSKPIRTIPYVRESEVRATVVAKSDTTLDRAMQYAKFACRFMDRHCGRRFDEYIDTLQFQNIARYRGGRIDDAGFLLLDHDLKEVISLTDSSGVAQADIVTFGSPTIRKLRPDPYNGWGSGSYITLTGKFGFGGYWEDLATTLTANISTTSATTFTVGDDNIIEKDMLLQLDDEYMLATNYNATTNTVTVRRGYNGSTAATHAAGIVPQVFVFDEVITQDVLRLTAWAVEQQRSPMSGQVSIGDFTYPVTTDGFPKDVLLELTKGGYIRVPRI